MRPGGLLARPAELCAGLRQGVLLGAAVVVMILPPAGLATAPLRSAQQHGEARRVDARIADFDGHAASADARLVADWIARTQDNRHAPFVILDKRDARVFVFDAGARLIDTSPVLLGVAPGDDSVAGIGKRPIAQVRPEERTTPAGRFVSQPGRNASGEDVVWVDYADSVSMHRVRPIDPKERRLERLASNDPAQRRISYGCINVPVAFFDAVIRPVLGTRPAVVYVLPETRDVGQTFAGVRDRAPVIPRT
jgi:hypothetical protein